MIVLLSIIIKQSNLKILLLYDNFLFLSSFISWNLNNMIELYCVIKQNSKDVREKVKKYFSFGNWNNIKKIY